MKLTLGVSESKVLRKVIVVLRACKQKEAGGIFI
jgi:hypothetical protein